MRSGPVCLLLLLCKFLYAISSICLLTFLSFSFPLFPHSFGAPFCHLDLPLIQPPKNCRLNYSIIIQLSCFLILRFLFGMKEDETCRSEKVYYNFNSLSIPWNSNCLHLFLLEISTYKIIKHYIFYHKCYIKILPLNPMNNLLRITCILEV